MIRTPRHAATPNRRSALVWRRRASPFARYALLAYTLLVIDASLYPFSGWRDLGLPPFAYLSAPWPRHALGFDVFVNVVGYVPLGIVTGLALYPRLGGFFLVAGSALYCGALSAALEAVQSYLPSRISSQVDLLTNAAGGLIGALIAARIAGPVLERGRLREWRVRWFEPDASRGLVLAALWFGALVYPEPLTLGGGALLKFFDPTLPEGVVAAFGLEFVAATFRQAEGVVCAFSLFGAGLLFANLLRRVQPFGTQYLLVFGFVVATAVTKMFMSAFLFEDATHFVWPTIGARWGFVAGFFALSLALPLSPRLRTALGFAAIAAVIALVNALPDNPYVNSVAGAWTRGRLMNFFGLAEGLNLVWPFLALVYFLRHPGKARPL